MEENKPKRFYYNTELKRLVDPVELEYLGFSSGVNLVTCYRMVVYGTLRQNDVGYNHFRDNFVCKNSQYYLLEDFKKVKYGPYFAVVPDEGSVVDCEALLIYPDTLEDFDRYEGVESGLYKRQILPDGSFVYVKGEPN